MLQAYVDNPSFDGDAIGAGDINLLVDNAHILNEESRRGRLAFGGRTRWMSDYTGTNGQTVDPGRIWWGAFQFRTGMTTATIVMWQQLTAGHKFVVTFDGTEVYRTSGTTTPAGETTISIDLAGRGYVDNQIVDVDVLRTVPNPANQCEVRAAYVGPVSPTVSFAWPGVPNFTNNPTRAKLKQLANAGDWLAQLFMNAREPVPMAIKFQTPIKGNNAGFTNPVIVGTFTRATNTDRFALSGYIRAGQIDQQTVRLVINETIVDSRVFTQGQQDGLLFDVDTSGLDATARHTWRLEVHIDSNVPGETHLGDPTYSVNHALTYRSSAFADPFPLPPKREPQQISTVAQWLDDLNRVALHYSDCFNRFAAAPDIFDRVYMFSRRYNSPNINSDYNNSWFTPMYVPQSWRRGEGLWIKGKGVKLCFGPATIKLPEGNGLWTYSFANEESLTADDKVETRYVAFDTLSGLNPGDFYVLTGDVRGAFQVWRQ